MGTESYTDLSSGLLDDYDFTVTHAWFGQVEESDSDRTYLRLVGVATIDGEVEDEEHEDRFGIGNGWEVVDEGAAVEHASGKNRFNGSSGIGRFITSIVEAMGDDIGDFAARGDSNEAKSYEGVTFSMKRKNYHFTNTDGEKIEFSLPLATTVVLPDDKPKSKGRGKAAAKPATKTPAKTSGRGRGRGAKKLEGDALRDALVKMASDYDDDAFDQFVNDALEKYPHIEDDDELHADLLDDGDDGIFFAGGE